MSVPSRHPCNARLETENMIKLTLMEFLLFQIVEIQGRENPDAVKTEILMRTKQLIKVIAKGSDEPMIHKEVDQLIGTAVCVIHSDQTQHFGYGASILIEKKGKESEPNVQGQNTQKVSGKKFWINLSCVHTWHPHVSYAVMKWSKNEKPRVPFPRLAAAEDPKTYRTDNADSLKPCATCRKVYSLKPNDNTKENLYGNCAETEAISELFNLRRVPFFDTPTLLEWAILRHDTQRDLLQTLEGMGCKNFRADVVYEPKYIPCLKTLENNPNSTQPLGK